jgi:hypothetical protein
MQINFNAGDGFTVHQVYPLLDQPGLGQCDALSGDSPNPRWLNFQSDPVYVWGNNLSIMYQSPTAASPNAGSRYPNIQEGRDYINGQRPGYTPFIYPHPLTFMVDAVGGSNTNSITNPQTNSVVTPQIAPPTGLRVQSI